MGKVFRIACHTIQWAGEHLREPEKVMREVAAAGHDGVEGFSANTPDEFVKLAVAAKRLGLHLVNIGATNPEERFKYNLIVGNTAAEVPAARRDQYGGKSPTPDDYRRAAEWLRPNCELAKAYGLKGFHHAHLNTMIETGKDADSLLPAVPDLYLLFDTGHLLAANCNPIKVLNKWANRIAHVHLKDTRAKDPSKYSRWEHKFGQGNDAWFEELGKGNLGLDVKAVLDGLATCGYQGWVSVEQDRCTNHGPADTAKVNREYLRSLGY